MQLQAVREEQRKATAAQAKAAGAAAAAAIASSLRAIEEAKEETGWKLVHGDVFRAPQTSPMLLSVFVGTGVQLLNMVRVLRLFGFALFLRPSLP